MLKKNGLGGRRREEGGGVGAQGSVEWEGERSWLLHEKENIKQEKGGEGVSGRKEKREGAHLDFFSKEKKRNWNFRAGRW